MTKKFAWVVAVLFTSKLATANLLTNGNFESGLTGWTVTDQVGGSGTWSSQTGTLSPTSGFTVASPPEGTFAAMTDQSGPGSHVLIQAFTMPVGITEVLISFRVYINNQAGAFATPPTLDYTIAPNQQARVDLLTALATPFDLTGANIVQTLFQTNVGDPLVSGYTLVTMTIGGLTSLTTYQLRFAEVDNQLFFNMGVDDVSVTAVPEPATFVVAGLGLLLVRWRMRARLA